MFLLVLTFLFSLHAEQDCPKLDSYYIVGNYKACSTYSESNSSIRCSYIKALCLLAVSDYDSARYDLSLISAKVKKQSGLSDLNGLSLSSMVEAQFMSGDYSKARSLAQEVNTLLSKKMPYSYPYFVSELLLAKAYLSSFDPASAKKRLILAKTAGMEPLLCASINTDE